MSYLHDDIDGEASQRASNRELTLSTGSILGIFFGLTLLCALFFGFGYNMGNKARQAPIVTASTPTPAGADFSSFKPSSGTPATTAQPAPAPARTSPPATTTSTSTSAAPTSAPPAPIVRPAPQTPPPAPTRAIEPPAPAPRSNIPASEAGITFTVQVAAVSHQEDAELVVAALKRKGYAVSARTEPQDKLFHIQVGPFPSKHDADAMRQRLQGDGYNAIVK